MWARINAFHAHYAFWVVELLPRQVQYVDLHGTFDLTVRALCALNRITLYACKAMALEDRHQGARWADVTAPEPRNFPSSPEEADQYKKPKRQKRWYLIDLSPYLLNRGWTGYYGTQVLT